MAVEKPLQRPTQIEREDPLFQEAMKNLEIEGNPLDEEDIAMFDMFHREKWSNQQCIEYINAKSLRLKQALSGNE